ncbi:MAG: 1-deoxy-D-xylulose-5-phosphate reductoisomerase [Rickettsiales bacterium]|nr:1-deoxy-D-xylulose-5-phosphate reductoisomerase [Rickettsiales bacterium]
MQKQVSILGATGTIGKNTLEIISGNPEKYSVSTLIARSNFEELAKLATQYKVKQVAIYDEENYLPLKNLLSGSNIKIFAGKEGCKEASSEKIDIYISGAVGFCALEPTLSAVKAGVNIGMANKECLVCAGEIIINEAKKSNAKIIPVDSEHNAIFQIFDFEKLNSIEKIILTASGGSFLNLDIKEFSKITPEMAVKHPNWNMGAKISVDSSTMMNKGLEVIEAMRLFPLNPNQIEVLVHPQSIIHGLVYYNDGSVLSALSNPDMKIPISYALGFPDRIKNNSQKLDLAKTTNLSFYNPDFEKFRCLKLSFEALNFGQNACVALNAANEIAVAEFLNHKIKFSDIPIIVEMVLEKIISENYSANSLEEIYFIDEISRNSAQDFIKTKISKVA